jgi:hypothetical protein
MPSSHVIPTWRRASPSAASAYLVAMPRSLTWTHLDLCHYNQYYRDTVTFNSIVEYRTRSKSWNPCELLHAELRYIPCYECKHDKFIKNTVDCFLLARKPSNVGSNKDVIMEVEFRTTISSEGPTGTYTNVQKV